MKGTNKINSVQTKNEIKSWDIFHFDILLIGKSNFIILILLHKIFVLIQKEYRCGQSNMLKEKSIKLIDKISNMVTILIGCCEYIIDISKNVHFSFTNSLSMFLLIKIFELAIKEKFGNSKLSDHIYLYNTEFEINDTECYVVMCNRIEPEKRIFIVINEGARNLFFAPFFY